MMKKAISYLLYPILLLATILMCVEAVTHSLNLKIAFVWIAGVRLGILLLVEFTFPLKKAWRMTWKSFFRDLKWMLTGVGVIGLLQLGLQLLALDLSAANTGFLGNSSVVLGAVLTLVVYEFFQYWYHRLSHEGEGKLGNWLWRVHLAHHLPDKVYLLMHPVFHPINMIFTQIIIQGSLILLGARPESLFIFNAIMSLQGLISHFNVDIKAGPFNYIFIGTELHRFHHSADLKEAKNYGSVITLWDLVFGTFVYQPNRVPERLGVADVTAYPESHELFKVLALPFKPGGETSKDES